MLKNKFHSSHAKEKSKKLPKGKRFIGHICDPAEFSWSRTLDVGMARAYQMYMEVVWWFGVLFGFFFLHYYYKAV